MGCIGEHAVGTVPGELLMGVAPISSFPSSGAAATEIQLDGRLRKFCFAPLAIGPRDCALTHGVANWRGGGRGRHLKGGEPQRSGR